MARQTSLVSSKIAPFKRRATRLLNSALVAMLLFAGFVRPAEAGDGWKWQPMQRRQRKARRLLNAAGLTLAHPSAKQRLLDDRLPLFWNLPAENLRVTGWNSPELNKLLGHLSKRFSVFGFEAHPNGHPYVVAGSSVLDARMEKGVRGAPLTEYIPQAHDKAGRFFVGWLAPRGLAQEMEQWAWDSERSHKWEACSLWTGKAGLAMADKSQGDPNSPFIAPKDLRLWHPATGFASWEAKRFAQTSDPAFPHGYNSDLMGLRHVLKFLTRQPPDFAIQILRPADWADAQNEIKAKSADAKTRPVAPSFVPFAIPKQ